MLNTYLFYANSYKVLLKLTMISLAQLGSKSPEQGTPEWLDLRKGRITGSKPASLMFDLCPSKQHTPTEDDWICLWEEWFAGRAKKPFTEEAVARMNYGSVTEDIAAEAVVKAMPGSIFIERPLIPINSLFAASPDGLLLQFKLDENGDFVRPLQLIKKWNLEIKCPLYECKDDKVECIKKMKKKKTPQYYYAAQIHFEMLAQGVKDTIFFNYTPHRSHLWKMTWDDEIWKKTLAVLLAFKEKACSFEHLQNIIQDWKMDCTRYAARFKVWKVIDENGEVITFENNSVY